MSVFAAHNGYSADMSQLNLANELNYSARANWENGDQIIDGETYTTTYTVAMNIGGGNYEVDIFAGNFSVSSTGVVTGGTVSGYYEGFWNPDSPDWLDLRDSATEFSHSAVDFYRAAHAGPNGRAATLRLCRT
jgi:hypothetical protein